MDSSSFTLSPLQEEIKRKANEFGRKWAPLATQIDRNDSAPIQEMVQHTIDLGLSGLTIPKQYGGKGLDVFEFAIATEESCRAMRSWMAGDILFSTTCTGPSVLIMSQNEAAKAKYLPMIASGKRTAAIALTEPLFGSAVTDLETAAIVDGGEVVINGDKRFITGAPEYDVYVVFVRFDGIRGPKGIGAVVLEKGMAGFTVSMGAEVMGARGTPHGELHFENCRISRENVLVEAGAFGSLMQAFNVERLYIAALCLGLAEGAFDEAVSYSNERQQFGQPINQFQAIYHLIAEMWTQIESVRYLTYKSALTAEAGKFPKALDVSVAKLHAADVARDVCWKSVQILGGNGVVTGYPPERCLRDVIVSSIAGGTSQILKNTVASQLLGKKLNQISSAPGR